MKAQTFGIKGSQSLLKAIWSELGELGYNISAYDEVRDCNNISNNWQSNEKNLKSIENYKELFIGIIRLSKLEEYYDKVFELPQQYDEALTFCKEQLLDKYWVKTPQKWSVGTFVVFTKNYGSSKLGNIDTIREAPDDETDNTFRCIVEGVTGKQAVNWFATRKEAKAFAETLKPKPVVEDKPKFKVGDYIINKFNNHIGRITNILGSKYSYWGFPMYSPFTEKGNYVFGDLDAIATPKEIEEFLIKVAKLKGYTNGCKVDQTKGYSGQGQIHTIKDSSNIRISWCENKYYNVSIDGTGVFSDKDGNSSWATIIPESKPIVKEFILPDKWCIKVTRENSEIIWTWRTAGSCSIEGYCLSKGHPEAGRKEARGYYITNKPRDTVELSTEQFKKYVLGKTIPTITKLPFGNLEFTIHKGVTNYASCKEGNITPDEIQEIVDWFDKDFTLLGHSMQIVNEDKWYLKFGCCKGTLAEAKAILKAFN